MIIKVGDSFHLDKEWNIVKNKDNGWWYITDNFSSGSYIIESINYTFKNNSSVSNVFTKEFDTNTNDVCSLNVSLYQSGSSYHNDLHSEKTIEISTNSIYCSPSGINYKTFPSSSIYPWNIISGSQP